MPTLFGKPPHVCTCGRLAVGQSPSFDGQSAHVKLLRASLRTDCPEARRSGSKLIAFIRQLAKGGGSEAARNSFKEFQGKVYFKLGDAAEQTKVNANQLRSDFQALPAEHTSSPNALQRALLLKIPPALLQQRRDLEDEFIKAEAL